MSSRAGVPRSFGGPSERCSRNFPEVADGSPAKAAGGLGQHQPTVIRGIGWSAIEEQGALCLPASCFFPCAPFLPEDYNQFLVGRASACLVFRILLAGDLSSMLHLELAKADRLKPVLLEHASI